MIVAVVHAVVALRRAATPATEPALLHQCDRPIGGDFPARPNSHSTRPNRDTTAPTFLGVRFRAPSLRRGRSWKCNMPSRLDRCVDLCHAAGSAVSPAELRCKRIKSCLPCRSQPKIGGSGTESCRCLPPSTKNAPIRWSENPRTTEPRKVGSVLQVSSASSRFLVPLVCSRFRFIA